MFRKVEKREKNHQKHPFRLPRFFTKSSYSGFVLPKNGSFLSKVVIPTLQGRNESDLFYREMFFFLVFRFFFFFFFLFFFIFFIFVHSFYLFFSFFFLFSSVFLFFFFSLFYFFFFFISYFFSVFYFFLFSFFIFFLFSRKLREGFFRAEPFRVSTSSEVHRVKCIVHRVKCIVHRVK